MINPAVAPVVAGILLALGVLGLVGAIPLATTVGNSGCSNYQICPTMSAVVSGWNVSVWVNGTINYDGVTINPASENGGSYAYLYPANTTCVAPSGSGAQTQWTLFGAPISPSSGCQVAYSWNMSSLSQTPAQTSVGDPTYQLGSFSIVFHQNLLGKLVHFNGQPWTGTFVLQVGIAFTQATQTASGGVTDWNELMGGPLGVVVLPGTGTVVPPCGAGCFSLNPGFKAVVNGTRVTFIDNSNITGGSRFNVSWNFGDGQVGYGNTTVHRYAVNGTYQVSETVAIQQFGHFNYLQGSVSGNVAVSAPCPTQASGLCPPPPPPCSNCNSHAASGLSLHLSPLVFALVAGPVILFVAYLIPALRGNGGAALAVLALGTFFSLVAGFGLQTFGLL